MANLGLGNAADKSLSSVSVAPWLIYKIVCTTALAYIQPPKAMFFFCYFVVSFCFYP